jgi:hypothetical protein
MKRFFQSIFVVVATLVILILAWQLRGALILFVLSLAVAAATRGPVNFWMKRGLSRGLGILLTYLLGLTFLGGLIYLVSSPVLRDLQLVTDLFDRSTSDHHQLPGGSCPQMIGNRTQPRRSITPYREQGTQLLQIFCVASHFGNVAKLLSYWCSASGASTGCILSASGLLPVDKRSGTGDPVRVEDSAGGHIRSELFEVVANCCSAPVILSWGNFWR